MPRDELRQLHEKQAARHLLIAVRQFVMLALATWGLIVIDNPLAWVPLAFVQGFTVFNFTVLLHEVVHHTVFAGRREAAERFLGWLYAVPSGISASQFTRWHLDHHAELGSDEDDPKRHHAGARCFAGNFLLSTGPNSQGGGKRTTKGHYDVPMRDCTVALDNDVIIERGRFTDEKMQVTPVPR